MNGVEGSGNVYAGAMLYGLVAPGTTAAAGGVFPAYGSPINDRSPAMKCDSGLTYAVPVSMKCDSGLHPSLCSAPNQIGDNGCGSFTFLGEDLTFQIQQQQMEVDRFVSRHVRYPSHLFSFQFFLLALYVFYNIQITDGKREDGNRREAEEILVLPAYHGSG